MIRIVTFIVGLAAAAPAAAQLAALDAPLRPTLKREAVIANDVVRIGDLVDNAGVVADVAIFRAPDLGQTGSVPAHLVAEAVRRHQIVGLDTAGIGEVVVVRASRAITGKDIEARVLRALAGQYGLTGERNLSVGFDQAVRTLHVEPGATGELEVMRISFDPRTRRFDATLTVPGSTVARKSSLRFTGTVTETTEAVVTLRAIAQNEIITASDVMIERRPRAELGGSSLPDVEDVLELAAKRPLRAGQVIRPADVMKPELVGRNQTVTMLFQVPGILLSFRGKALEPGAMGDVISVLNPQSKRTVQAVVTGPNQVTVSGSVPRLVSNERDSQRKRAE
jgi:flagella basal body P-ring formation protein FlgA